MNYYQQADPVANINPFQQNVDIIKNFFKKPIVLVNTLFDTITIPLTLFAMFLLSGFITDYYRQMYSGLSYFDDYYSSNSVNIDLLGSVILIMGIIACIPAVLTAIAKFIIYFKSKSPNPNANPSSGFTILWILSIITVSLAGLACFLFLIVIIIVMDEISSLSGLSSSYYGSYYGYSDPVSMTIAGLVILLIIFMILIGIMFFYLINQLRFYSSVRKGLNSIYLKRNGAMVYGVLRIVGACFNCFIFLFYILALLGAVSYTITLNDQSIPLPNEILSLYAVNIALAIGSDIIGGIIAVKYAGYIKSIVTGTNQQFNANLPYSNPISAVPFNNNAYAQSQPVQNNPFDNIQNQNPYANPQQINPQEPQAPVSDNQYYEPVGNPDPQEDSPQAEDTSQTEETFKTENNTNNNVCPNCGSPVFISDMFCNNCGTKLK